MKGYRQFVFMLLSSFLLFGVALWRLIKIKGCKMDYLGRFKQMCFEFDMLCNKDNYSAWLTWLCMKGEITDSQKELLLDKF